MLATNWSRTAKELHAIFVRVKERVEVDVEKRID